MISVIIPLKNGQPTEILTKNLQCFEKFEDVQVIPVVSSKGSRAERINDGIEQAKHKMILIVHPRSYIGSDAIEWLLKNANKVCWGGFTHSFDHNHPLLKFTSWYSNQVRGRRGGIVYLDHCIFYHRGLLDEARPVPEVEIFEDTEFSKKLKKKMKPIIVNYKSTTSAVRFKENGVVYQSALNQVLKLAYYLNAPDKVMNKIYEKGLNLN